MTQELREVKRIVAVGTQGVGKSVETIRFMLEQATGWVDGIIGGTPTGVPQRKGLIFDVNDEFGDFPFPYSLTGRMGIKAISIEDITLFTVHSIYEVRRVRPFFQDGRAMTPTEMSVVLVKILKDFNNGILLVEDPNTYISDNIDADIIGKLISTRHRSTDMIMHFQGIGRAGQPKIFSNTSFIRMHKVNDTVSRHKGKFNEKTELLQIAEFIVNKKFNEGNTRFFLFIDIERSKIRGKFNLLDAEDAVHEYVSQNYKIAVTPYLLKRDKKTGEELYKDVGVAMDMARKEKLKTYFNFS